MLQPVGPLPPSVYWRRRAVTLAVLVGAVALVITLVLSMSGNAATPVAGGSTSSAAVPTPTVAAATTGVDGDVFAPVGGDTATTAPATTPSTTPSTSAPAPTTTSAPPPPPKACAAAAVKVTAGTEQASFRAGVKPTFLLTVTNVGKVACVRDLDAADQELLLFAGETRIWSSNDCYPEKSTDVRTLAPKAKATFDVVWSGLGSDPGCDQPREQVGPGTYQLVAVQGGVKSAPVTVTVTA